MSCTDVHGALDLKIFQGSAFLNLRLGFSLGHFLSDHPYRIHSERESENILMHVSHIFTRMGKDATILVGNCAAAAEAITLVNGEVMRRFVR